MSVVSIQQVSDAVDVSREPWVHGRDCRCGDRGQRVGPDDSAYTAPRERDVICCEKQQVTWFGAPGVGKDLEG